MKRPSIDAHVPKLTEDEISLLRQSVASQREWREAIYQLKRKRIFGKEPPDLYQVIKSKGILDDVLWNKSD